MPAQAVLAAYPTGRPWPARHRRPGTSQEHMPPRASPTEGGPSPLSSNDFTRRGRRRPLAHVSSANTSMAIPGEATRGAPVPAHWVTWRAASFHTPNRPTRDELSHLVLPRASPLGCAARAAQLGRRSRPREPAQRRRSGTPRAGAVRKDWPCWEDAVHTLAPSRLPQGLAQRPGHRRGCARLRNACASVLNCPSGNSAS